MRKVFFILFLTVLTASCSKEGLEKSSFAEKLLASERNNLPEAIQLLELLKEPTDGYIALTSIASYGAQNFRGPEVMINGYMYDKTPQKQNVGNLNWGTQVFSSNASNNYQVVGMNSGTSLFGTQTTVGIAGNTDADIPGFNANFYVPKLMTLTAPAYSNLTPISPNLTIEWVADPLNDKGVGVMVYYDRYSSSNIYKNFSQASVKTLTHTEDDGSYTISASDLAGVPSGAIIDVMVGRGNYQRVPMGNNYHVGLVNFSIVSHNFMMQ
jgi:hypothetical protein